MRIRVLTLALAFIMVLSVFASCAKKTPSANPSGTTAGTEKETTVETDNEDSDESSSSESIESGNSSDSSDTEGESSVTTTTEKETDSAETEPPSGGDTEVSTGDEAYYIIEAVAEYGRNGLANGWNYDNRFDLTNTTGNDTSALHDKSDEKFYRLIRDFEAENDGIFKLEMIISAASCANEGIYIHMCDENDKPVFGLTPKEGKWSFFGKDSITTDIEIPEEATQKFGIQIEFDMNNDKARLTINNTYCGEIGILDGDISRLILGTNLVGTGSISFTYVRLMKNYPLSDRFIIGSDDYTDKAPANWDIEGDFMVQRIDSMRLYDMYSVVADSTAGTVSTASRSFAPVSGLVSFEAMILLPKKTDGVSVALTSGGKEVIAFETRDGGKIYVGEQMMHDYMANVWQTLHIDANTSTGKAEIYINGKIKGEVAFDAESFDGIKITFAPEVDAVMWFDDIEINEMVKYADYPSEPQVAPSDDYNIGMNVCWLWRDQQSGEGWDATSPFSEFDPYLGYYDEGLRETADWELKWMAEHGIDFVHVCWYCPSSDIQAPIKEMRHSYAALHDGYMMAEYSDLVDFCIMWENNGGDCSNFGQWRQYIWNYWAEYYFSDPRYARIDNKAVLTVWSTTNLVESFGGVAEAKKAIKFMDSELKKMGYDGLILLSAVQGSTSADRYEELAELGFSATYAYHWGASGYKPEHQIDCNNSNIAVSNGILHHIPTVSIGFNDVGRNETRDPIISVEDHLRVCKDIKKTLKGFKTNTWMDNTLFISTWNEYSEGTYLFPTESTGFDYLENIRLTFTNDTSDHSEIDVRPTEAQVDRVTHLYPPNHSPIRWYQFEKADTEFDYYINVNGTNLIFTFAPKLLENGDFEVVGEARKKGFYSALRLYHEWDRYTGDGVLTLYTFDNKKIVFTVGSDKATVDSKEVDLGYTFTLRDGLPVFHIKQLCDMIGYKYFVEGDTCFVQACSDEEYSVLKDFVPNQWEFNIPGETQGWKNQNSTGKVTDNGTLLITPTSVDVAVSQTVSFFASNYTVVRIGIKYNKDISNQTAQLFFTTTSSSGYSADKCISAKYNAAGKGEGDTIEAVFVLASNVNYMGKITGIRIDPYTGMFPCEIDYIRCEYDESQSIDADIVYVEDGNQWEFNTDKDVEGWTYGNIYFNSVSEGFFNASAKNSDPIMYHKVDFNAKDYHILVVGMKYFQGLENLKPQIYFQTKADPSWNEAKSVRGAMSIPQNVVEGQVINIYFNLDFAAWSGTISEIRFDPFGSTHDFSIDYIRFAKRISMDPTLAPVEKVVEITDAEIIPEGFKITGSNKNSIAIVDDPTAPGNKVFKVECTNGASDSTTYTYLNLDLALEADKTYVIKYKIMPLKDYAGNDFSDTIIGGNLLYATAGASVSNHTFDGGQNKSSSDEWIEITGMITVAKDYDPAKGSRLQLWGKFSPQSGYGISYLVKDISVAYQIK